MGPTRRFPRIPQPGLFMTPQKVIRDALNPWRHNLDPPPVQSGMIWDTPLSFQVGQPVREGHVTLRFRLGHSYPVYSIDGISTSPYRCLIRWPKEGGGDSDVVRRLSTKEIWRIKQFPEENYVTLWDQEGREEALRLAAGDSICKPMADVVAKLTERRIWQLEEKATEASTVTVPEYEPPVDDYRLTETDSDEEGDGGHIEMDSEQKEETDSDIVGMDVLTISLPNVVTELLDDSPDDSGVISRREDRSSDRDFRPNLGVANRSQTRQRVLKDDSQPEPPLGKFSERDIVANVAQMVHNVPRLIPTGSLFPPPSTTGYAMEEYKSLIIGCNVQASLRWKCRLRFCGLTRKFILLFLLFSIYSE